MRIGLVLEQFDPLRGGREQWTFGLADRLAARGHEVHVAARGFAEAAARLPVTLHAVRCGWSPQAFTAAVRAALEPLSLDVIHDMGAGWYCDVFQPHSGSRAALTERKLLLLPWWLRGLKHQMNRCLPRHRGFRSVMRRQYADHGQILLALSQAVADDFQRLHGVPAERIRLVHNGVDLERFSPWRCTPYRAAVRRRLQIGPQTVLALIVAHNFQLKGVPALLRAVARLRAEGRGVCLAVVGGRRLETWRRRIEWQGLGQAVTLVGPVADPVPYYAAADLYVHPTFYDACSLVALEAAACGLPVITSRYNGAAEVFGGSPGVRVIADPAHTEELAAAMRPLLDPAVRREMAAAARQTMLTHSLENNVDRILDVYQEVIERRRLSPPQGYGVWTARVPAAAEESAPAGQGRAPRPVASPPGVPA